MKVIDIKTGKETNFLFQEKNLFLCKSFDSIYQMLNIHESIFTNKASSKHIVNYSDIDFKVDKHNKKIVIIPSYLDFYKDIQGGNKAILKELVNLSLQSNFFTNENLVLVKNVINSIEFDSIKPLDHFIKEINNELGLNVNFQLQDNFLDYLSSNLTIGFFNEEEIDLSENLSQLDLKKIYLNILVLILELNEKEFFYIFINPFLGMDSTEINHFLELISKLKNYSVISNYYSNLNMNSLTNLKVELNDFVDLAIIFNDLSKYQIYWENENETQLIEFMIEFWNKFLNLNLLFNETNNIKYLTKNELDFLEVFKNK